MESKSSVFSDISRQEEEVHKVGENFFPLSCPWPELILLLLLLVPAAQLRSCFYWSKKRSAAGTLLVVGLHDPISDLLYGSSKTII
jgi:hypothetical protein